MEKKTNVMSVIALICGILGILSFGSTSIIGLILAIIAKKKDADDKLAKAGLICSIIGLVIGVICGIGCIACTGALAAASTSYIAVL